jgi:DNA recombination protein RmuC
MIFILGIVSTLSALLGYANFELFKRLRISQNKEKEMIQDLNAYTNLEQSLQREQQHIQEKYTQLLGEKDKYINELKQNYANQLKEIKQENELRLVNQKQEYDKVMQKLEQSARESFSNIANTILEQKGKNLQEQSLNNIQHILAPFKADITNFKQLIHTVQSERTQQHASLETQIKAMQGLNHGMMQTAENLTKALKGENKTQGNWGEMIVKKILDSSGLISGEHYTEQGKEMGLTSEDGKREQPDFIINLPNNKHIVLDSKVSLTHYERYCNEENDIDLKGFLSSVQKHIGDLSSKGYHNNRRLNSPDFTMMFIPIEAAYFLAVQKDNELYQKAWEKRIALCCPSTLLAMLQTISNLWEIDMQNKNAQEIVSRANEMYKKFQGFTSSLEDVGRNLDRAKDSYSKAYGQFKTGNGNLDGQFTKMISLVKLDPKVQNNTPALSED